MTEAMKKRVVVLGASDDPSRYSYRAVEQLKRNGYEVTPVSPRCTAVLGIPCKKTIEEVPAAPGTLSLYVSPEISSKLTESIIKLHPDRIIFNPGAENPMLAERAKKSGIEVVEGCTLVMLSTGTF